MMANQRKLPDMKVVNERVEEDLEVSDLVTRLEAEADSELASERAEAALAPQRGSRGPRA